MGTSTITIRTDSALKKNVETVLKDIGLTMSGALNIYLKKIARDKKIPFELESADPFYNEKNQKRLREAISELEAGKGEIHDLIED